MIEKEMNRNELEQNEYEYQCLRKEYNRGLDLYLDKSKTEFMRNLGSKIMETTLPKMKTLTDEYLQLINQSNGVEK